MNILQLSILRVQWVQEVRMSKPELFMNNRDDCGKQTVGMCVYSVGWIMSGTEHIWKKKEQQFLVNWYSVNTGHRSNSKYKSYYCTRNTFTLNAFAVEDS